MKLHIGEEHVLVRGDVPEKGLWGSYQFPRPYNLDGRLLVAVNVSADNIKSFGNPNLWFESNDNGETWEQVDPAVSSQCGLKLPSGDKLYFPMESGISLSDYEFPEQHKLLPDYDFTKPAEEGTMPYPDGFTYWLDKVIIRAYNADRLPPSLAKKEWTAMRTPAGQNQPLPEKVKVDWPYLTRVVFSGVGFDNVLKPIYPRGNPKIGPDGAIWISAFSGEGHLNPENGQYSPYYSAELFRSEDNGHSFQRRSHMEYEANGHEYPYRSGGFSDSDFEFMPDGSIVWFFRSAWFCYTGWEWDPMYMARSTDGGFSWSEPVKFAGTGILPRLCRLACGTTLLCYARPGMYVCATLDDTGTKWSDPLELMTPENRSHLANHPVPSPSFHDWDGACNNPEMVAIDDNNALFFYSDFYYPDENGVKRKTILCRKITVES